MMRQRTRPPIHPGGILKRQYLEPLGIGVSQAALALGISRKTLSKILNERGSVTPEMALRLSRAFNTTAELWLNLQRNYDLWHAAHSSEAWREVETLVAIP
jgi:addiction module HigA family antidote